jgi:hypothetical protein
MTAFDTNYVDPPVSRKPTDRRRYHAALRKVVAVIDSEERV